MAAVGQVPHMSNSDSRVASVLLPLDFIRDPENEA
jgi:hypothetical protein